MSSTGTKTAEAPKGGSMLGQMQAGWESFKQFNIGAAVTGAATNALTSEVAQKAKAEFDEIEKFVLNGHWSWQILAFLGGVAMAAAGLYSFLDDFLNLNIPQACFDVFVLLFGALIAVLEYKEGLLPPAMVKELKEEFLFIYKPIGRAFLLIFFGTLLISEFFSQGSFVYLVVGPYILAVGFIIGYANYQAAQDFKKLKANKCDITKIKTYFNKAAKNRFPATLFESDPGSIDSAGLAVLMKLLGTHLSHNELEIALLELDANHDGKISWDEFIRWYDANV